jgi:type IV pilus assembly protein PilA
MKKLTRAMHRGQKGFTLIELLIVVAILGILAAVIIPNVAGFMTTGKLNAANTELENVKTAGLAYFAEYEGWPTTTANVTTLEQNFVSGELRAHYTWEPSGFIVSQVSDGTNPWALTWSDGVDAVKHGKWTR